MSKDEPDSEDRVVCERNTLYPDTYQKHNFYSDELCYWLSAEEYVVLDFLVRRIMGFERNRRDRRDRVSISQMCDGIKSKKDGHLLSRGTGLSRETVVNCVEALAQYRIILKIGEPTRDGQEYELNLDIDAMDLKGLRERKFKARQKSKQQTAKARAVCLTDRSHRSVQQTASGLSNRTTKPTRN